MGQVLAFNNVRKVRGETLSPGGAACFDMEEKCSEEIRAKLSGWVAELSAAIAPLEMTLGALNARIALLPVSQSKIDLESHRSKIVIEIYKARRLLADIDGWAREQI